MDDAVVNAVYYPSWRVYKEKTPSMLRAEAITHIFYAFVGYVRRRTLRVRIALLEEMASDPYNLQRL